MALACLLANCQETKYFGETFDTSDPVTVEQLLSRLDETDKVENIVVSGAVDEVCQVKGCWMTMSTENGSSMRVTFKDYGFFVPKDIHGRTVVIRGYGEIVVTSVDDLRHYAEDEGRSEEEIAAITEPEEEYTFVADGVYLE
jgi:hypothetical protein